ncbi:MAG TPA: acyl-CoA dehydrogenase C-terminal domain-containing protein [Gammaproteobacteria bacterium]|nr:acyl-CoA dehydrogenase C-terminal domain-containing protein [Gammaproteobacteria bacterium]
MAEYTAPLRDMQFVINELAGLDAVAALPGCGEVTPDLAEAVLDAAGKFATEVLSSLNRVGDKTGAKLAGDTVTTPPGFKEAYARFVADGWNGLALDPEYGGQGLPQLIATPVIEMWQAANMAFALCPMLTEGAVEALMLRGSDALKNIYLPKMVSGEWTGSMNLTEPQAGSDLGQVRTRAVREGDHYRITGQKIFITYGEHDWTDNIIHMVLARTPDAPEGVKGISMFVVPKFLVNEDGSLGARNDVHCASLEHKLGIHASPTAVLSYGEKEGAIGYLIGEENHGLAYMFIMMNMARFAVGVQGLGISERAWQQAVAFAKERVQSADASVRGGKPVAIIRHPDVRRMLMSMKAKIEAMRALCYVTATQLDISFHHADEAMRQRAQAFVDLMIPVVKGWCTENAIEITSTGIQIHGGMGFIEETGAAQHFRDARISTIYEGTTGIQAKDLIGRKLARDGGVVAKAVIAEMRALDKQLAGSADADLKVIHARLAEGIGALEQCVDWLVTNYGTDIKAASAGAVPFLKLFGIVAGGWQMARAALVARQKLDAGDADAAFYKAKLGTARYYADYELGQAEGLQASIVEGAAGVLALDEDQF